MVKFIRTWKKTAVAIAMLSALAFPGCATLDAAYSILEASNPVFFILSKFFFRPVFASLKEAMEEYGEEILAKLPPGLRKTVNTVREFTRKVEALKEEVTEMKALRALVKKQVDQTRDAILRKTGIVKTLNAAREKALGPLKGKSDGLIKRRNEVNAQLATNTNELRKRSGETQAQYDTRQNAIEANMPQENVALMNERRALNAELKKANAELANKRAESQAELNRANQELAETKTKAAEQEKELSQRDREIAKLNAKLAENEKQLEASRNSMQRQMLAMEAENEGLRKRHEEMLKRINASKGVANSPMVFKAGPKWDETQDTVEKVTFKEKEFQRVAWPDQISNQFQDWNPDIKPIEIEMQQNVLYTAMVMKESPKEFQKLEKEIEKKVEEEAANYDFNVVRKK